MTRRLFITGGPLSGKSTMAANMSQHVCCTDTLEQAMATGRHNPLTVYAPERFNGRWSELSEWVSDVWMSGTGPIVLEGVAVPRALRKRRKSHPGAPPPCTELVWLRSAKAPRTPKQSAMTKSHDTVLAEVLADWPELRERLNVIE